MKYIIDAYNVIHAWKNKNYLKSTTDIEEFLSYISIFADTQKGSCAVVFDGDYPYKESIQSKYAGLNIIFSSQHSSADSVIERMVQEESEKGRLTVITSDHIESFIALGSGAGIISPIKFFELFTEAKENLNKRMSQEKLSFKRQRGFTIGEMIDDSPQ